jgi:hypothetical protein
MVAMEERRKSFILLLGLYVYLIIHAREACCEHSSNTFARRVEECCNIEFGV